RRPRGGLPEPSSGATRSACCVRRDARRRRRPCVVSSDSSLVSCRSCSDRCDGARCESSAMKHRSALVAIVGLTGAAALAPVQAGKRPARRAVASTPDEAFVAAREAFARHDLPRFEAAAGPAREHALAEYLDFWRLRMRIQPPQPEADSGAADAEIRRFIDRHPGTLVADLMRRDWLLNLGRRGIWTTFDTEYPQWVLRDDE